VAPNLPDLRTKSTLGEPTVALEVPAALAVAETLSNQLGLEPDLFLDLFT
jgi:hypothetical protein